MRCAALVLALSGPVWAQETHPLSAVDWLSGQATVTLNQSAPPPEAQQSTPASEPPATAPTATDDIQISDLVAVSHDQIGLLSSQITGLPKDLWTGSSARVLRALLEAGPRHPLPALQALGRTLLLAEADPPAASAPDMLFLARIDRLIDIGALDPALEMLRVSGHENPEIFRRWFDVALLTGYEDAACEALVERPDVAADTSAQVFCLARMGDWSAAELTLTTARTLGEITAEQADLLARFLDPDLFEGDPPLPAPKEMTPLAFRAREAIGEGLPSTRLPLAYAEADLRPNVGWKAQLEAAERLSRAGVLDGNRLIAIYRAGRPSASGGIWERSRAVQRFDAALKAEDSARIDKTLPEAWAAMSAAQTEVPFAQVFCPALARQKLGPEATEIARKIILLCADPQALPPLGPQSPANAQLWHDVATGKMTVPAPQDPRAAAVYAAFSGAEPPPRLTRMLKQKRIGEALLRAIALFEAGRSGDPVAVRDALALMRAAGQESRARQAALQYLILERQS